MFGKVFETPQNEKTPFHPRSPYGVAKVYAHWITVNYREAYNIFACNGILFNHESPRRCKTFVTKKIISTLFAIKKGENKILELGNIYAKRDWGYAGDYIKAMMLMTESNRPEDFVVATGKSISVKEFIIKACEYLNLDIIFRGNELNERCYLKKNNKLIIKINKKYFRKKELYSLKGDCEKIKKTLGWRHESSIDDLINKMIDGEQILRKSNFKYI